MAAPQACLRPWVPADQISTFWPDLDQRDIRVWLPVSLAIILFEIVQN
jgi:hypothetical protein